MAHSSKRHKGEHLDVPFQKIEKNDSSRDHAVMNKDMLDEAEDADTDNKALNDQHRYVVNDCVWSLKPLEGKKQQIDNEPNLPKILGAAQNMRTPLEIWSLLFTDEMLDTIVKCTNKKLQQVRIHQPIKIQLMDTNIDELKAFIGILYFSGLKSGYCEFQNLSWGLMSSPLLDYVMPKIRYSNLITHIRFDEENEHDSVQASDIRNLWNLFLLNCQKYYSPSKHVTIDMLLSKARVDKERDIEELKIHTMNDSETHYMINSIPDFIRSNILTSHDIYKLSKPIHMSHRNIICIKNLMSVALVKKMKNDYSLSMVGVIFINDPEVPAGIKQYVPEMSMRCVYTDDMILAAHYPKRGKVILLLSSSHEYTKITSKEKLSAVQFYNSTKRDAESFKEMYRKYTTARFTCNWPMRLFCEMLDQAAVNSFILYSLNTMNKDKLSRCRFLEILALNLTVPHMERYRDLDVRKRLEILSITSAAATESPSSIATTSGTRIYCYLCAGDNADIACKCPVCKSFICDNHRSMICKGCVLNN